jgi:hypothetical protein
MLGKQSTYLGSTAARQPRYPILSRIKSLSGHASYQGRTASGSHSDVKRVTRMNNLHDMLQLLQFYCQNIAINHAIRLENEGYTQLIGEK